MKRSRRGEGEYKTGQAAYFCSWISSQCVCLREETFNFHTKSLRCLWTVLFFFFVFLMLGDEEISRKLSHQHTSNSPEVEYVQTHNTTSGYLLIHPAYDSRSTGRLPDSLDVFVAGLPVCLHNTIAGAPTSIPQVTFNGRTCSKKWSVASSWTKR